MSAISKLNLSKGNREEFKDPVNARRQRLIDALGEQKQMASAMLADQLLTISRTVYQTNEETGERVAVKKAKRVRPWYWHNIEGTWFFEVRSANRVLELTKGMKAVEVGQKEKLPETIDVLIEAVKGGELDAQLEASRRKKRKVS